MKELTDRELLSVLGGDGEIPGDPPVDSKEEKPHTPNSDG